MNQQVFPEQHIALLDSQTACPAHMQMQPLLPGHSNAAVDLHTVTCRGVVSFRGRKMRIGCSDKKSLLSGFGCGVNAIGSSNFKLAIKLQYDV